MNFSADERAELIGAVTRTTEMVGALLDLVDRIGSDSMMGDNSRRRTLNVSASTPRCGGSSLSDFGSGWRA